MDAPDPQKEFAEIDILVNNAGLALGLSPLWEIETARRSKPACRSSR